MTINGGYVLKPRSIRDSWIAHAAPVVREVWDWLIMNANYKEEKYNGFTVGRGQIFCRYQDIREALSWNVGYRKMMYSEDQTKHCMKLLTNNGMIAPTKTPRGMLITICNYSTYQDSSNYEYTNERAINTPTSAPSIPETSLSITKEVKELKNINTIPSVDGHEDESDNSKKKSKFSFDRDRIRDSWNAKAEKCGGLPKIRTITKTTEQGLIRLYKSYLKQCKEIGKNPNDMDTLINGYIEIGYSPTEWAMGNNPDGKKFGIDTALTQKKIDEILGGE